MDIKYRFKRKKGRDIFQNKFNQSNLQIEVCQQFPESGYVEMCPMEIYKTTVDCIAGACEELRSKHGIGPEKICAIGITNQRGDLIILNILFSTLKKV